MLKVVATVAVLITLQQVLILRYGAAPLIAAAFLPTDHVPVPRRLHRLRPVDRDGHRARRDGRPHVPAHQVRASVATMRAVVDRPDLLALTGTSPVKVRRGAWLIGTMFAGLSGVLLVPLVGLEPNASDAARRGGVRRRRHRDVPQPSADLRRRAHHRHRGPSITTKYVSTHPGSQGLPAEPALHHPVRRAARGPPGRASRAHRGAEAAAAEGAATPLCS